MVFVKHVVKNFVFYSSSHLLIFVPICIKIQIHWQTSARLTWVSSVTFDKIAIKILNKLFILQFFMQHTWNSKWDLSSDFFFWMSHKQPNRNGITSKTKENLILSKFCHSQCDLWLLSVFCVFFVVRIVFSKLSGNANITVPNGKAVEQI